MKALTLGFRPRSPGPELRAASPTSGSGGREQSEAKAGGTRAGSQRVPGFRWVAPVVPDPGAPPASAEASSYSQRPVRPGICDPPVMAVKLTQYTAFVFGSPWQPSLLTISSFFVAALFGWHLTIPVFDFVFSRMLTETHAGRLNGSLAVTKAVYGFGRIRTQTGSSIACHTASVMCGIIIKQQQ